MIIKIPIKREREIKRNNLFELDNNLQNTSIRLPEENIYVKSHNEHKNVRLAFHKTHALSLEDYHSETPQKRNKNVSLEKLLKYQMFAFDYIFFLKVRYLTTR